MRVRKIAVGLIEFDFGLGLDLELQLFQAIEPIVVDQKVGFSCQSFLLNTPMIYTAIKVKGGFRPIPN